MRHHLPYLRCAGLSVILACLLITACTQKPVEPSFSTPWVGVIYPTGHAGVNQTQRPDTLLADSDFYFPRGEKYIVGPQAISTVTASSEFTYDAQPIGLRGGSGYHYSYQYRENVTIP